MRNLEDCKAEVFRRSEKRIKERKRKRNRVLACCIPLCLLFVAGGIFVRPLLQPMDEIGRTNAEDTAISNRDLGGIDFALFVDVINYTSVEIIDRTGEEEVFREITDAKTVGELCNLMVMSFAELGVKEENATGTPLDGNEAGNDAIGGIDVDSEVTTEEQSLGTVDDWSDIKYGFGERQADYTLVFQTKEGEELIFLLRGNELYDDKNDCTVTLADTQLETLKRQIEAGVAEENGK